MRWFRRRSPAPEAPPAPATKEELRQHFHEKAEEMLDYLSTLRRQDVDRDEWLDAVDQAMQMTENASNRRRLVNKLNRLRKDDPKRASVEASLEEQRRRLRILNAFVNRAGHEERKANYEHVLATDGTDDQASRS